MLSPWVRLVSVNSQGLSKEQSIGRTKLNNRLCHLDLGTAYIYDPDPRSPHPTLPAEFSPLGLLEFEQTKQITKLQRKTLNFKSVCKLQYIKAGKSYPARHTLSLSN